MVDPRLEYWNQPESDCFGFIRQHLRIDMADLVTKISIVNGILWACYI